jgi:hypothetical protein
LGFSINPGVDLGCRGFSRHAKEKGPPLVRGSP